MSQLDAVLQRTNGRLTKNMEKADNEKVFQLTSDEKVNFSSKERDIRNVRKSCDSFAFWISIFSFIHLMSAINILKSGAENVQVGPGRQVLAYYRIFTICTLGFSAINHIWICNHLDNAIKLVGKHSCFGLSFTHIWSAANIIFILVDMLILPVLLAATYAEGKLNIVYCIVFVPLAFGWSPYGHVWSLAILWFYIDHFEQSDECDIDCEGEKVCASRTELVFRKWKKKIIERIPKY